MRSRVRIRLQLQAAEKNSKIGEKAFKEKSLAGEMSVITVAFCSIVE